MRIVIGEDSALFREGLARLLEDAGHEVVGRAADAVALVETVEQELPDLAVIDVRMPPDGTDDGARAARTLRDRMPDLAIVMLSQHVETRHSVDLVAGGRFGYLLKDRVFDVDDFLDALRRVAEGGSALDPEVVATLLGAAPPAGPAGAADTPRARGPRADGRGAHQRRHRPPAVAHRPDRRDPRQQHHPQARSDRVGRGAPPGARRPDLAGGPPAERLTLPGRSVRA